jgi:thiosulfate dehydrogenase
MKEHGYKGVVLVLLVIGIAAFWSYATSVATGAGIPEGYVKADLKQGGLLYDNWTKFTDVKVSGNHPLYPAEGKQQGGSTWRCKECHGWDYIGKDGRYSKGSHFTGIKGVFDARLKDHQDLYKNLTDSGTNHDFSKYLKDNDIWALVKFLREGLVDISTALDSNGAVTGSADKGKPLYQKNCAMCHGDDGRKLDFNDEKEGIQGVGELANDNPQETLHKIRWGQPGTKMPSAVLKGKLTDADTIDLLAYTQILK